MTAFTWEHKWRQRREVKAERKRKREGQDSTALSWSEMRRKRSSNGERGEGSAGSRLSSMRFVRGGLRVEVGRTVEVSSWRRGWRGRGHCSRAGSGDQTDLWFKHDETWCSVSIIMRSCCETLPTSCSGWKNVFKKIRFVVVTLQL